MSDDPNPALAALGDEMCAALARHSGDDLWAATQRYSASHAQHYVNAAGLTKAIDDRDPTVRVAAIALLHELGDASVPGFYERLLQLGLTATTSNSVESLTARVCDNLSKPLVAKLSPDRQARLWLDGKLSLPRVSDAAIALTSLADVAAADEKHGQLSDSVHHLMGRHPDFGRDDRAAAFASALLQRGRPFPAMRVASMLAQRRSNAAAPIQAAAVPLLAAPLHDPDVRQQRAAAQVLLEIGTQESLAVLAGVFDRVTDASDVRLGPAVQALVRSDPAGAYERFHHVVAERSLSPMDRAIAAALAAVPNASLAREPRWLDRLVVALASGVETARWRLAGYDRATLAAALTKHGWKKPARSRSEHPVPKKPKWLERYQAGKHDEVWTEIVALEDSAHDPAIAAEVKAVAAEMMARVKKDLEQIVAVLTKQKYPFAKKTAKPKYPLETAKKVITPPGASRTSGGSIRFSSCAPKRRSRCSTST